MEHPRSKTATVSDAEARVRAAVSHNVGNDMTEAGLREAMRCFTFDGYRQDAFKDGASTIAIVARAG